MFYKTPPKTQKLKSQFLNKIVEDYDIWDNTTYKDLQTEINKRLSTKWEELETRLLEIQWTTKSESTWKALDSLVEVYDWVKSSDLIATQKRINELKQKFDNEWLTASEMNEVKILHTKSNDLFNDAWKTTKWFTKDDLRWVRKDIKQDI